ncbi:glycosyltransferase family 2 protein [Prevotella sp. P6B4]|uniref:glycosyltransferase family 2 protein n=1 Tax=Prevotella sp. P6B4 TaxID=1410614 RepID=UPI0018CC72B8|nr:glycosyltransferase family 2 protein [Prevotella sp. P6B4]
MFSIVIPTYNHLPLLKRALDSVLQQQDADYEVIVTDDSDNNEISNYIKSIDKPIRYFRHESSGKAADNWNYGLSKAEGKFVILMHHDEAMVSKTHLRLIAQQMEKSEVVITDVEVLQHGKKRHRLTTNFTQRFACQHPKLLFLQNTIGPTACLAFRRNQMQQFNSNLTWLVDVEWYYRMLQGKQVSYYKSCKIQSYHGHERQITQHLNVMKEFRKDKVIINNTYGRKIQLAIWLYEHIILGTKKLLGKI